MPGIAARYRVDTPPGFVPRPYSLLTAATVLPMPDPHARNGIAYDPEVCSPAGAWEIQCARSTADKLAANAEAYGPTVEADPFVVYATAKCSVAGGFTSAELAERARAKLLAGESYIIERTIMSGAAGQKPSFRGATDVTPTGGTPAAPTPLPVVGAIATLEDKISSGALGQGMIHVPPAAVPYLTSSNLIEKVGSNRLQVVGTGTSVAVGSGYVDNTGPDGTEAEAGRAWLYATGGPMVVYRDDIEILTHDAPDLNNDIAAIAERTILASFSCGVWAVQMDMTCCGCG